jgi:HK97 family phage major capsid protein
MSATAEMVQVPRAQLEQFKSKMAQLEAQAERNKKNVGAPGALYASKAHRDERIEQAMHCMKLAKAMLKKDPDLVQKVMDEKPEWYHGKAAGDPFTGATDGQGGYTIPSIWSEQIFSNVDKYGFARKLANVFPMGARSEKFNVGGGVTGGWVDEDTAPTAFDATSSFTQTTLTAHTLAAAVIIGKDFQEDTAVAIVDHITDMFARFIGKSEDIQFFNGTGTPFTGIVGTVTTNVVTMAATKTAFSQVTWKDMVDLKMAVNPEIMNDGAYVVSKAVLQALLKDVDDNGRPIYTNEKPTPNRNLTGIDQAPWDYNGSPLWVIGDGVLPTSAANRVAATFGAFKKGSLFGVRQDMQMDTFDQAYKGIDLAGTRMIALAVHERVSMGFPDETMFATLKTAAS